MALNRAAVGSGGLSGVLGAAVGGIVPTALMAPEAATRTSRRTAPAAPPTPPAPVEQEPPPAPEVPGASDVPPTLCRCGHDAAAHEHYRRGTDCGACGAQSCARFRAARRGGLRGWLRGALRGRRAG
jgi:hypothetical protein